MQSSAVTLGAHGATAPKVNLPRFGMLCFLVSEGMLFAGLIAGYFILRVSAAGHYRPDGAPAVPKLLTGINTLILISSSFTCLRGEHAIVQGRRPTKWLLLTAVLGTIFLSIQAVEWTNLYREHMWFNQAGESHEGGHVYSSVFFVLTGFHGAHVAIGVLLLAVTTLRSLLGHFTAERHAFLECSTLYWHFVDVVWVILYTGLYLL